MSSCCGCSSSSKRRNLFTPGTQAACTAAASSKCSRAATKAPSENQPQPRNHSGRALACAAAAGDDGCVPNRPELSSRIVLQKASTSASSDASSVTVSSGAAASQSRRASSSVHSACRRASSPRDSGCRGTSWPPPSDGCDQRDSKAYETPATTRDLLLRARVPPWPRSRKRPGPSDIRRECSWRSWPAHSALVERRTSSRAAGVSRARCARKKAANFCACLSIGSDMLLTILRKPLLAIARADRGCFLLRNQQFFARRG